MALNDYTVRRSRWFDCPASQSFTQAALIARLKSVPDIANNNFVMITLTIGDSDGKTWNEMSQEEQLQWSAEAYTASKDSRWVKRFMDKLAAKGYGRIFYTPSGKARNHYFCAREFQKRGMVHFHILLPLDPATTDINALENACEAAWKRGFTDVSSGCDEDVSYCSKLSTYAAKAFARESFPDWIEASEGYRTFRTYSSSRGFLPPLRPSYSEPAPKAPRLVQVGDGYDIEGWEVPKYTRGFRTIAQFRQLDRAKQYTVTIRQEGKAWARSIKLADHPALNVRILTNVSQGRFLSHEMHPECSVKENGAWYKLQAPHDPFVPARTMSDYYQVSIPPPLAALSAAPLAAAET